MTAAGRTIERMAAVCDAAAARGAEGETWAAHHEVDEVTCRAGRVERRGTTSGRVLALTIWQNGLEGTAAADPDEHPSTLVDQAISVARLLPPRPAPPRPVRLPQRSWPGELPRLDDATADALAELSRAAGRTAGQDRDAGHQLELRLRVERRTVALLRQGDVPRWYEAGTVQLRARLSVTDGGGRSFVVEELHGRRPDEVVRAYARHRLADSRELARTLSGPAAGALDHDAVLLDGQVVTELMHALTPAFQLATVRRGLSPLVHGERSFAPGLAVVDDLRDEHSPLHLPWDDEGTPIRRTELVRDGVVSAFLADRRTGLEAGVTSSGAGWRGPTGEAPTVRPGCLILRPAPDTAVAPDSGRVLRVVQSNGAHTADELTGNFSIAADAVLRDDAGGWRNAGQITVAGNLFTMLRDLAGHDGRTYVRRGLVAGYFASPGLWATGLAIGR